MTKTYKEYKGCTIERTFPSGNYIATVRTYNAGVTVRADTLAGLKALICEALWDMHLSRSWGS